MDSIVLPDDHQECIDLLLKNVEKYVAPSNKTGVLHLGAHSGEEVPAYRKYGYTNVVLCEANPNLIAPLTEKFSTDDNVNIVHAAISNSQGSVEFYIHETEKGSVESASLLPLKELGDIVPVFNSKNTVTVPSVTLDSLANDMNLNDSIKLLTMDIQGAEKLALEGGAQFLKNVDAIICEVNRIENYENCALEHDIDEIFDRLGFTKRFAIYHELYKGEDRFIAWGECVWTNTANAIE